MSTLRKLRPGERLSGIPADVWNRFVAATIEVEANKSLTRGDSLAAKHPTAVRVRNDTGTQIDRFGVLDVTDSAIDPTTGDEQFSQAVVLIGGTPSASTLGRFCVTLEPIAPDAIGLALMDGVAIVSVDVTDDPNSDRAGEIIDDVAQLALCRHGSARVLYREPGTSGTRLAVVRLGACDPFSTHGLFVRDAALIGGSAPPRYLYSLAPAIKDTDTGNSAADPEHVGLMYAHNTYECDPWGHGQALVGAAIILANGATVTPSAVEGPVRATWTGTYDPDGVPLWEFEAACPMDTACP